MRFYIDNIHISNWPKSNIKINWKFMYLFLRKLIKIVWIWVETRDVKMRTEKVKESKQQDKIELWTNYSESAESTGIIVAHENLGRFQRESDLWHASEVCPFSATNFKTSLCFHVLLPLCSGDIENPLSLKGWLNQDQGILGHVSEESYLLKRLLREQDTIFHYLYI